MGKADRMTEEELEYIRAVYPELGPSAIARNLGRSLSAVKARIKEMGLKKETRIVEFPKVEVTLRDPQDKLDRLIETRELLRKSLVEAPPNCIASISKEYRAVLKEIDSLENGGSKQSENPLEQLAKKLANGM